MLGLDNPIHIAFVLVLLLLVFGAKRLPEMGKSLGEGLRGFKDSISGEAPAAHLSEAAPAAHVSEAAPAAHVSEAAPAAQLSEAHSPVAPDETPEPVAEPTPMQPAA